MKEHEGQKTSIGVWNSYAQGSTHKLTTFCFDILELSMRILQRPCHKVDRESLNEFFFLRKWYMFMLKLYKVIVASPRAQHKK
jgi:hypothetical protein